LRNESRWITQRIDMFTELEMSHEDMIRAITQNKKCAVCGHDLQIAWGGAYGHNSYILTCGVIEHHGITRHDKEEENKRKEYFSMDSTALQTMSQTDMVARVNMAKFPKDLTPADKALLAQAAITYGFDPIMGEISIFQGKPFISIDGRYRKAQETGLLDGVETRPATKEEKTQWEIPDGDYFFRADVHVKGMKLPLTGWGRVRKAEVGNGQGFQPVQNNPQRMAEKRAEAQALRKAFHIPLPSLEDIGTPEEPAARVVDVSPAAQKAIEAGEPHIDMDWLKENLHTLKWNPLKHLEETHHVDGATIPEAVAKLNQEQSAEFVKEVQKRLNAKQ
jgi:hypothetical protein